jgi:CheY-like chemotaxis protein
MSKHILIVDDSQSIRTVTRSFLESQPRFAVCGEAVDGLDALDKARDLHPDLIILDLEMPRMNGFQTARALRTHKFLAPIILFTIYADAVRPQDAEAAGVSAVVSKSDLSSLQQEMDRLLLVNN